MYRDIEAKITRVTLLWLKNQDPNQVSLALFSTVLNVYSKVMVEIRAEPTIEGKPLSIRGYIDRNAELKVT